MSDKTPNLDSELRPIRGWAVEGKEYESVPPDIPRAIESAFFDVPLGEPLPEQVTVVGYVPLDLPSAEWIADRLAQEIEETLGEEYGDPEGTELPESARLAISNAAKVIRQTYPVYWLKPSDVRLTVCPRDYFAEGEA